MRQLGSSVCMSYQGRWRLLCSQVSYYPLLAAETTQGECCLVLQSNPWPSVMHKAYLELFKSTQSGEHTACLHGRELLYQSCCRPWGKRCLAAEDTESPSIVGIVYDMCARSWEAWPPGMGQVRHSPGLLVCC